MEVDNGTAKPEPMDSSLAQSSKTEPVAQENGASANGVAKQEEGLMSGQPSDETLKGSSAEALPLRLQKLPLPKDIKQRKAAAKDVVVISFGSFGIRYGFAVDSTPKRVFPAVAFPRHPSAIASPFKQPLRMPAHSVRSPKQLEEARERFESIRDSVAEDLRLNMRRRGGGRPIPWRAVIQPVAGDSLQGPQYTAESAKTVDDVPKNKVIVGHDVELLLRHGERAKEYDILFPIWDGKLLFDCGAPDSLVRKALDCILEHIVEQLTLERRNKAASGGNDKKDEKTNGQASMDIESQDEEVVPFQKHDEAKTFVALVMPETSQRRDTAEIVDAVFRTRTLQTAAVFIHQSAVSCAFGAGLATCAVVDIGHSATTVACVEDGLICGESRIHLNYGSSHVQNAFEMLLKESSELQDVLLAEPGITGKQLPPERIAEDHEAVIAKVAEQTVSFNVEVNDTLGGVLLKLPSGRGLRISLGVGFRALPCYGLIHPTLLSSASEIVKKRKDIPKRGVYEMNADDDNFGTDIFNDLRRSGIATAALPIGTFANDPGQAASRVLNPDESSIVDAIIWSVAKAVELKRPDQQSRTAEHYRRYLNAIVLAGGGASIDGIALALESRIRKGFFDAGLSVPDVTVIDGGRGKGDEELAAAAATLIEAGAEGGLIDDTDTASLPWKGGAVMVEADAVRDYWIYRDDWEVRNVRALRERAPFYW